MRLRRNIIWLVPLCFIVTFPFWSIPVGNFLSPRGGFDNGPKNQAPESNNFNMDRVQILQNQKGEKTALIRAQKAHTGEDPNLLIMEEVNADIYDREGNITTIVAKTGKYSMTSKILTLIDQVVIDKSRDKQRLYTDLLFYDSGKRTVDCPGKTRLEGDKVTIDGGSLHYDIQEGRYVIGKGVDCTISGFIEP